MDVSAPACPDRARTLIYLLFSHYLICAWIWFCRRGMMVSLALLSPNTALACIFSYVSLRVGRIIRSYVRHQECLITDQVLSSGADVDSMLPVVRGEDAVCPTLTHRVWGLRQEQLMWGRRDLNVKRASGGAILGDS
jgi:hypothetical protein